MEIVTKGQTFECLMNRKYQEQQQSQQSQQSIMADEMIAHDGGPYTASTSLSLLYGGSIGSY